MDNEFTEWKSQVNYFMMEEIGIGTDDIPDYDYYKAFSLMLTAQSCAKRAVGSALLALGL